MPSDESTGGLVTAGRLNDRPITTPRATAAAMISAPARMRIPHCRSNKAGLSSRAGCDGSCGNGTSGGSYVGVNGWLRAGVGARGGSGAEAVGVSIFGADCGGDERDGSGALNG